MMLSLLPQSVRSRCNASCLSVSFEMECNLDAPVSCLLQIQHAEISIMRASFILTHRPGKKFHFMDYILASMDDDCAKVMRFGIYPGRCVCALDQVSIHGLLVLLELPFVILLHFVVPLTLFSPAALLSSLL